MGRVSVSELKSRLSQYLREVGRGGEVEILDRGVPIARLSALPSGEGLSDNEHRERLIQAGIVRPGSGDASKFLSLPPLELPASILESLEEERADRL